MDIASSVSCLRLSRPRRKALLSSIPAVDETSARRPSEPSCHLPLPSAADEPISAFVSLGGGLYSTTVRFTASYDPSSPLPLLPASVSVLPLSTSRLTTVLPTRPDGTLNFAEVFTAFAPRARFGTGSVDHDSSAVGCRDGCA